MKTCLVIDDSRVIRKITCRILRDLAFEPVEAESGEDALAACQKAMPDVILLDWNLPHMSGIEFLKSLRKEKNGKVPVVLFCTTENDVAHIKEAMGAGADEYIMKPFDRSIIEAKFAEVGLV